MDDLDGGEEEVILKATKKATALNRHRIHE